MKRAVIVVAALSAVLWGCGPQAIDVSGQWNGTTTLNIVGGETALGQEPVFVSQDGDDLDFSLGGCRVKANASSETVFDINDFECQRTVNTTSWRLEGQNSRSQVTASETTFNVTIRGDATAGEDERDFNWSFAGTR